MKNARDEALKFVRLNAWELIRDCNPELVPIIRAGVAAGKPLSEIVADCAAIEPDEDVLGAVEASVEYLRETPLEEQLATEAAIREKRRRRIEEAGGEEAYLAKIARLRPRDDE